MTKTKEGLQPPCDGCQCRDDKIKGLKAALRAVWALRPPGACTNAIYEANRSAIDSATNEDK